MIFFLELHEKLFLHIKSFNVFVSSPIFNNIHNKTDIELLTLELFTEDCYNYGDLQIDLYGNIYDPLVNKNSLQKEWFDTKVQLVIYLKECKAQGKNVFNVINWSQFLSNHICFKDKNSNVYKLICILLIICLSDKCKNIFQNKQILSNLNNIDIDNVHNDLLIGLNMPENIYDIDWDEIYEEYIPINNIELYINI